MALRRAKKRNMERLQLSCGGVAINSVRKGCGRCLGACGNFKGRSVSCKQRLRGTCRCTASCGQTAHLAKWGP